MHNAYNSRMLLLLYRRLFTEVRRQNPHHAEASSPVVSSSTPVTGETSAGENSSPPGSEAPPSDADYDVIDDVIEDEDEVAATESVYDDLQESTRDPVIQAPSVYEKIRPAAATAATGSHVTAQQNKQAIRVRVIGSDKGFPTGEQFSNTAHHKYQTCTAISAENATKASTL